MTTKALVSVIPATFMLAGHAFAEPYRFVPIDVECPATAAASSCPAGLAPGQMAAQTSAKGINSGGDIVGSYIAVVGGPQHGFLLSHGQFSSLDFPMAGVRATVANGINARGEIVGQYSAPVHDASNPPPQDSPLYCPAAANPTATNPACIKGFHYWGGQFSTVTFPTTFDEHEQPQDHPGAIAQRISADGDIYGCLHGHDLGPSMHGAAWTRTGTRSLLPNGGQVDDTMGVPMSMNNGGTPGGGRTIVGFFVDMENKQHGYLVKDGMLAAYDPDGADLTAIWDINSSGQFVGVFRYPTDLATKRHGFLKDPDSLAPIQLDFTCEKLEGCAGAPMHTVAFTTFAFGVNSGGVVVGQYSIVSGGPAHGFVAFPPDAELTTGQD